jgi:hypothetical protein
MSEWTDWVDIETAKSPQGPFVGHGIYQIRIVDEQNEPIPISRIGGIDPSGLLHVGRSGHGIESPTRTIANRLKEFIQQQHSGGKTYARAREVLLRFPQFANHQLQARAMFVKNDEIDIAESRAAWAYLGKYGELPPCNSSLPRAWEDAERVPDHVPAAVEPRVTNQQRQQSSRRVCPDDHVVGVKTSFRNRTVTRELVLDAMRKFDEQDRSRSIFWRKYCVRYDGRDYPPKFVLSLAAGVSASSFSGGWETNRVFCDLGFEVLEMITNHRRPYA